MRTRIALVMTTAALVALVAAPVFAQSSKAAWRFKEAIALSQSADIDTTDCDFTTDPPTCDPVINSTAWVNILRTYIKTPNAKELAIGVSLQCGIVTDTTVRSVGGDKDTSAAQARIKVRVKITQPDGSVVYAQPDDGADITDLIPAGTGVTYCDRYQKLEAKFAGLDCWADLTTGEVTCLEPEELRLILKTLNANHFNFLHANAVPGVQMIEVQAKAQAGVALGGSFLGEAGAEAFAGAGSLSVETIRLIKDADGTTDLEGLR